jgi:hypothetical protein
MEFWRSGRLLARLSGALLGLALLLTACSPPRFSYGDTHHNQTGKCLLERHGGCTELGCWQGVYHLEGDEAVQPEVNRRIPLSELKARIRAATATVPPPAYVGAMMLKGIVHLLDRPHH